MNQTIDVRISGSFPAYQIIFSDEPTPVPYGATASITYVLSTPDFSIVAVNMQRHPFGTLDELTWAIPRDQQSLILTDRNVDKSQTTYGIEIVFADKKGNRFSSPDPEVVNEGEP